MFEKIGGILLFLLPLLVLNEMKGKNSLPLSNCSDEKS
jgi:hypothetical protein